MLPWLITATRCAIDRTSGRLCVMNSIDEPEVALQVAEQLDDRGLDADVQRRGHLVADQHGGVAHQRPGDRDPLPLAAGELVGIAAGVRRRSATPARASRRPAGRRRGRSPCRRPCSGCAIDLADRTARVQRAVRVLEDVLDLPAGVAAALARRRAAARCSPSAIVPVQSAVQAGDRRGRSSSCPSPTRRPAPGTRAPPGCRLTEWTTSCRP